MIITDIDTAKKTEKNNRTYYEAINVESPLACYTSNATIKYYYDAPEISTPEFEMWYKKLMAHGMNTNCKQVFVAYQNKEKNYYARSFEDSFISINLELIKTHKDSLWGIKNTYDIETENDMFKLTASIIDKKSDFASSILFLSHTKSLVWNTPQYITEGIEWLQKQTN